ncbi:MAG: AMP-binding protein [Rothia sp.]|uniref:AMP-binding protein n=1 Tax=Rothia sp. (in: high G+C Gram-positive bacteria) TaxID=1885016 RepID=UPI001CB400F9|nr:AMP-binding protein [Rothia sp. (in: high G+C Gram-positive bacteria)]MBF1680783.1 AMP-binding protein [Rothia sp. (in: high G+C Gram-positive bacteria)]
MMNTPVPGLAPSPAPQEAALHPQAVQVRADQPADPHAMLGAFEQLLGGYALDAESAEVAEPIALVVGTSGSTGTPKRTALTARALAASAAATENFFAGNADSASQWLLALPAHYIAGAQVLARSVLAGTSPVIARSVTEPVHFSPEVFLQAVEQMSSARRFISLVPTQLHKLLESADADPRLGAEIHEALGSFTGILLGGAPTSADLLAAASALGLNTVTTYGSAETAGGCVYSGSVLPGVRVELVPEEGMPTVPNIEGKPAQVGRIWISGAHLASGYIGDTVRTAEHFFTAADGTRWYRTDDYGLLSPVAVPDSSENCSEQRLQVLGRSDDVLISGGVKISARAVATVLEEHPAVREACVIGLPDARWGTAIAAAVTLVPSAGAATASSENGTALNEELCALLRARCAEKLGAPAAPKQLSILPDFPLTSTGKPDRAEIYSILDRDYRQG